MLDLGSLNSPQREAVVHEGGPLVVFAGAGSGKTRVITFRIAHLIATHDVAPWTILAVTFTNKAAGEMRDRLLRLLGEQGAAVQVGTFHATCARLLRRHGESFGLTKDFTIYDDQDQLALVKRVLRDLGLDEKRYQPKAMAGRINRAKQEIQGPDEIETPDTWSEVVRRVYTTYEERLHQANALDFGDLIYRTVRALESDDSFREAVVGRFSHVLVDEFQDTNHAQFRLVQLLSEGHRNLCVVGDDDQSIYRWRGADRRNILDFRASFPDATLIKLEQNYRSTQRILRAANAVIARNTDREPKELWTDNQEGDAILVVRTMDERDEARLVLRGVRELLAQGHSLSDVVVFYRTHAQSRVIEESLRSANIAYRIVGGMRFYDRAEVKDLLAYLRVMINPADDMSLLRIINTPTRGIGKTTITRLLDYAAEQARTLSDLLDDELTLAQFGSAARKRLGAFAGLMSSLRDVAASGAPLGEIGAELVTQCGYAEMLKHDDTPEADARFQNIQELVASMDEFEREHTESTLADFLENVTLHTSADEEAGGALARTALSGERTTGGRSTAEDRVTFDDGACGQGPGVPGGHGHRPRRASVPFQGHRPLGRPRGARRGAAARVRGLHAGEGALGAELCRDSKDLRPAAGRHPFTVPDRAAGRRHRVDRRKVELTFAPFGSRSAPPRLQRQLRRLQRGFRSLRPRRPAARRAGPAPEVRSRGGDRGDARITAPRLGPLPGLGHAEDHRLVSRAGLSAGAEPDPTG